ncbi:MAG: fibronectin type III domain-containing protein [Syntrophomonas sp.]
MHLRCSTKSNIALLTVLVFVLSIMFTISPVQAAAGDLTVTMTAPENQSLAGGESAYQITNPVSLDNIYFCWNFSNGIDTNLESNLQEISLKTKGGEAVTLGTEDFTYTKEDTPEKLRQLELTLDSAALVADTDYIIEFGSGITANNSTDTLGKIYSWEFNTGTIDNPEPPVTAAPTWPDGSKIETSNIDATSVTLKWTAAQDTTGVTGYKIYQDGVEIGSVNGSTLYYDVSGLISATEYNFKIEAGNADDSWSQDGPSIQAITGGGGQLLIEQFSPPASEKSSSETQVYYTVNELIAPDNVHFAWNFSNGLNSNLIANLEKISLVKKSDNTPVTLDRGDMTQEQLDLNTPDIITLGDFTYTKQQTPKLRQIDLILSQSLEPFTTYIIKISSDFQANAGGKLGKSYYWEFTTTDPGDLTPPTWPESKQLTATRVTPNSVTLQWTAAQDNVIVAGYKILQDSVVVQTVNATTNTCNIDGLTPSTDYNFRIEAVDGNGNQSIDGPNITVTTIEADIIAPTWPEGSELTITHAAAPALVLHWTEAADDWGLAGYQVYQDGQLLGSVDNSTRKYHVTGLEINKSYNFMVKAVDSFNNCSESGPSLEVVLDREDNTSPIWSKDCGWSVSNTPVYPEAQIIIQWATPMDDTGIFAYRIYQNDVLIAEVDESVHSYSLVIPFDNQHYTFRIAAGDAAGNWGLHYMPLGMYTGDPNEDLESPTWPADTVISASEITDNTLKIQWTAAEDNLWIEKYSILMDGNYIYSTNIGEDEGNPSFAGGTCLFDIEDCKHGYTGLTSDKLVPGTEHEFYIIAWDRHMNGKTSPKIKVTLGGSPTMGAALGPLGKKGFSIAAPECINASVNNITDVNNRVINPVDPAHVYFCWDFTTALKPADDPMYMGNIILKNKLTGEIINLTPEDLVITQSDTPTKVRRVELQLKNALQDKTAYILTLKKDFCGQSIYDGRLGRDYNWEFTTAVADSEKPTWPIDAQLAISQTPTSLTLTWPPANDNVAVTSYEIVKTGNGNDEVLDTVDSKTTSYSINDLTVNTGYSFKVRARDYIGNWSDYLEVTGTTAETDTTCPTWENKSLTSSEVAASSLVLNWQPAQDDWGVVAYAIYQNGQEIARVNASDTSYTVEGLNPVIEYTFKIEAGDAFNNWSSDGPEVQVSTLADTTIPTWPEDSTLTRTTVTSDSITLEWTAANDDVAVKSYKIFQNGTSVQEVEGKTTCTVSGLTESTEYVFKAEAVDAAGNCSNNGPSLTQWTTPKDMAAPAGCHLAMGYFHTLLLRNDGSLWASGDNQYGQLGDGTTTSRSQPVEIKTISGIKSVAAGRNHSIALKKDGTVWAWGNKTLTPTQVPGLTGIIGIGAGDFQSFAFDGNGNIWSFGSEQPVQFGQLEGITAIAGGRFHTLALKNDRTVWAWGTNESGAIGTGNQGDRCSSPVEVPGLTGIVQIDAMTDNSAVVKADGTVWTFGQNQYGQLGDGTTEISFSPIQVPNLNGVKAVAVAKYHMEALKDDGSIWSWGHNGGGRLGNGTEEDSRIPVQALVSDISMLATGEWATVAIKSNGTIMAWGGRGWSFYPTNIGLFRTPVLHVAPGNRLVNQAVDISFEDNADWRTNISQITVDGVALTQDQYTLSTGVLTINAVVFDKSRDYTVVIKALGYDDASITIKVMSEITQETVSFDENTRNLALTDQITAATISCPAAVTDGRISLVNFLPVPALDEETITSTALPSLTVEAITSISSSPVRLEIPPGTNITAPIGWDGIFNVPTLKKNDSVKILDEEAGNPAKVTCVLEIGCNDIPLKLNRAVRILIPGQAGKEVGYCNAPYFTKITRVCAEDSQAWADANISSGSDAKINVGNDLVIWTKHFTTFVTYYRAADSVPVIVNNLSAGGSHSMYLDSNGNLWTWGKNHNGVLGPGATTDRVVPMKAEGLNGFISISSGTYHNMGLKADGTVWTWGSNVSGQLGYTEPASTDIPLQVPGLSDVASIMCGDQWSVAVKKDGTVWTWGAGAQGRLGNGELTNSFTPVHVEGLTDIVSVATGGERNIAIKKDGTVWGWGRTLGDLIPNTTAYSPATTPIQLEGLTGVIAVDAGWGGQLAVKDDGTVWSWVRNADKVLVPQQLDTITDVKTISIKRGTPLAIKNDGTVWTWRNAKGNEDYASPPTQIEGLYGIIAVEPGEYYVSNGKNTHALALRGDGEIAAWGLNGSGQLGDGTNITSLAPVQVLFDKGTIAPQWSDKTLTSSNLGQNSLTLTWAPATDDVCAAAYRVYQNGQIIGEAAGYTTTFNVTGLEAGTTYSFKVEAGDGAKNWSSDGPMLEVTTVPLLVADTTNNTLGQPVSVTFTDNAAWRTAITEITIDGVILENGQYQISEGTIAINAEAFTEVKDYAIVVKATGYLNAAVTQTMVAGPVNPVYTVVPVEETSYTSGTNQDGFTTLTVNAGVTGLKYFGVNVVPVTPHEGIEAVVFTHTRNNTQMTINVTKADFDSVSMAQAGFNVLAGDIVRTYVVDDLTNSNTVNPIILQ